jgi:U1 small nuclear ribonucleoprotein 70kDa
VEAAGLGKYAGRDAGKYAGRDAGKYAGRDAGKDAGRDAGRDAGKYAGKDAGKGRPGNEPRARTRARDGRAMSRGRGITVVAVTGRRGCDY